MNDAVWDQIDDAQLSRRSPARAGEIYGAEAVDGFDLVIIADTPADAGAAIEAGAGQALALPVADMRAVLARPANTELLGKFAKLILAFRDRPAGEELARRLGRHRCLRAALPTGAGLADVLNDNGHGAVRALIEGAEPWPIEGVTKATAAALLDFRHQPLPPTLTTGCAASDRVLAFPSDGKLIFVTGIPNHGKSTWVLHIAAHTAAKHGRRWAIFSPEMAPWTNLAATLISWRAEKPFRPQVEIAGMTDDEIAEGADWCRRHFTFLSHDSLDEPLTLAWLLERVAACVLRDGVTDFLIDPWNEVEHGRGSETEAEYLNRNLQQLRAFCNRHGVNCWIIAHPTKLRPAKPGDAIPVPSIYDVAGGAAWANKADLLLVVHRPDTVTEIHVAKARFRRYGERGAVARLTLDRATGRFRSESIADATRDPCTLTGM